MKTNTKLIALASVLFSIASLLAVISDVDAFNGVSSPTLVQSGDDSKFYFEVGASTTITYSGVIVYTSPSAYTIESMVQTSIVYSNTNIERVHAIFTGWYYHNLIPLNFIFNKNNGKVLHVQSSDFVVNNTLIRYNPTNAVGPVLEVYTIDLDTMTITTIPQYLWEAPDIDNSQTSSWDSIYNFFTGTPPVNTSFVAPAQIPLIIKYKDNTYAFVYLGTDGFTYTLQMSGTTPRLIREPAQAVSIGPTFSFNGNTSFFVRKYPDGGTNSSGSFLVQNDYDRHFETSTPFHPGIDITNITTFENPILYFKTTDNSIYSWDLNCTDPLYSTCRFDFTEQANYCAGEPGVFDPRHIRCDIQVSTTVSQNSSSGSTSSGSTSSGSYGPGTSTSSTTVSFADVPQTCTGSTFSGTTILSGTSADLQPNTCTWRTYNSNYSCQDVNGHFCTTSGDACLQQIDNPSQYTGSGTSTYSGDITKFSCASTTQSCTWTNKNTCGPASACYSDGDYCRVNKVITPITIPSFDNTAPGIVNDLSNPIGGTGGFSVTRTGSSTPLVYLSGSEQKLCTLFDEHGNFLYKSAGSVNFNYDYTSPKFNKYINLMLGYISRLQTFIFEPLNAVLAVGSSFYPPAQNQKICLMGIVYEIDYQSFLKLGNDANTTIGPFKDSIPLHFDGTKQNILDYFVLFFFVSLLLSIISLFVFLVNLKK